MQHKPCEMGTLKLFKSIILGAPGSGKGTISARIVNNFLLEHISSGDKLRLHVKNKSKVGLEVGKYLVTGQLVPDNLMVQLILEEINNVGKSSWLLDGFPRTLTQAENLWSKQHVDFVLNLNVPFDVIIERVKGRWIHLSSGRVYNTEYNPPKIPGKDDITGEDLIQREDDKPDVVKKRLEQYMLQTKPVIDYYSEKGILKNFYGNTSDEIWKKVFPYLGTLLPLNSKVQQVQP